MERKSEVIIINVHDCMSSMYHFYVTVHWSQMVGEWVKFGLEVGKEVLGSYRVSCVAWPQASNIWVEGYPLMP